MKRSILYVYMTVLSLLLMPNITFGLVKNVPASEKSAEELPPRVKTLFARLSEIKEMDKSNLTRTEKIELRHEVRSIKSELRATNNGIYLSVGAIIIIILLLILIL